MILLAVIAACVLAFANGANDNSKGVATLIGARTLTAGGALRYAAAATLLGSLAAIMLAGGLIAKFSGKGLVDATLLDSTTFMTCVGLSAAGTVLLATRLGMPISTTHSLVGGLVGVGLSAGALHAAAVVKAFLIPLLAAPALALVTSVIAYVLFRSVRLRLGVTRETCVCIERKFHPVTMTSEGALIVAATGVKLSSEHDASKCFERYRGAVVGLDAQRVLDRSHLLSAGAISFARGLNDTPKIAAIIISLGALSSTSSMVAVGLAIAIGGLLAARRVADTMSRRITDMNDGQAFTANLVTAALVIFASKFGIPVSTTHVSCGSLFGIGLVNGRAHPRMIVQIVLAWVTTLPMAAGIGWLAWRVLGA